MRKGFSLLELVVVLAIMGISLAVVAPAFVGDGELPPLEAAARETTHLLRTARLQALREGRAVEVAIDAEAARFWVRSGDGSEVVTGHLELGAGVELHTRGPRATFVFRPDGTATADSLTLSLDGRATQVSVDPWVGEAHAAP